MNMETHAKYSVPKEVKGEIIKEARKILSLSQKDFAEMIGVSKPTVERWEAGDKAVSGPVAALCALIIRDASLAGELVLPVNELRTRLIYMYEDIICTVIDVDETIRKVKIINYTDNLMLRAFGKNTEPTFDEYEEFLESRCFPRGRDKMKLELERLNIPFYDPMLIISKTEGRMAEDRFWLKVERW